MKLNNPREFESILIVLTKEKSPIAYNNKIEELVEEGAYQTKEEAEINNPAFYMQCELYYEKGYGTFIVESEAVEIGDIYSPYNGKKCEHYDET